MGKLARIIDPPVNLERAVIEAMGWIDEPYDWTGLLGMSIVCAARWVGKAVRNPWHEPRTMFCSEFIVWVLREAWCPGALELDPASTDPETLLNFLVEQRIIMLDREFAERK
jgi:hypothetical protein